MRWASFSTNSNLSSELTRLQVHNLENVREGVYLNDSYGGRLTASRSAAGADELCRGGGLWLSEQTDGDAILAVGTPRGQCYWHPPRPWRRPPSLCSGHSCRTAPAMTMGGRDLGAPTSQVARQSAARSGQPQHSDQTARRQQSGGRSLT
jgi:hypothetical protein